MMCFSWLLIQLIYHHYSKIEEEKWTITASAENMQFREPLHKMDNQQYIELQVQVWIIPVLQNCLSA